MVLIWKEKRGVHYWLAGLAASLLVLIVTLLLALLGAWLLPGRVVSVAPLFSWGIPCAALVGGLRMGQLGGGGSWRAAMVIGAVVAAITSGLLSSVAPLGMTSNEIGGGILLCTILSMIAAVAGANSLHVMRRSKGRSNRETREKVNWSRVD